MRVEKLGFVQSYNFVKKKRPIICPNFGFVRQLKQFESEIKSKHDKDTEKIQKEVFQFNPTNNFADFDDGQKNICNGKYPQFKLDADYVNFAIKALNLQKD